MVRSSVITFVFQIASLVIGTVSRSLLARMLHPYGMGLFTIFVFIPTLLHAASNLGLNYSIVNFVGRKKYDTAAMSGLALGGALLISIITVAVSAVIYAVVRSAYTGHDLVDLPNAGIALAVIIYIPYMLWFCNLFVHLARNRIVQYNIVWTIQPAVAFIGYLLTWLLLFKSTDIVLKSACVYFSYSIGIVAALIAGLIMLSKEGLLKWTYPKGALKESIIFGIKTHIGSFVGFLGLHMSIPFINSFLDTASIGIYSTPLLIGEAFKRIFSSISTAMLPIASSAEGEKGNTLINVVMRNTIFICGVTLGVFALVCRPVILLLFGKEYLAGVGPTLIILIWTFFTTLGKVFQSDSVGRGKPLWITYTTILTFVVLFVCSWIMVPRSGLTGAAWASTFSAIAGYMLWIFLYVTRADGFSLLNSTFVKTKDFGKIFNKLFRIGRTPIQPPED